jgi:GntR family transcriptional regulator, transcriptional repressor for pyruvate dehydrogenase complex
MAMDVVPISRAAVSDAVFGQLVDAILSGKLAPEDPLPSERELAESFEVNRHAVREALKRVQQAGLVRISQGGKTRVLDWRTHAGLDALTALTSSGAVPAQRVLHDIAVMRCSVGADAARLCATNATERQLADLMAAAEAFPEPAVDAASLFAADHAFWSAVIAGSDNIAYQLGLNTLVAGILGIGLDRMAGFDRPERYPDREAHLALARLIVSRDAAGAHQMAEQLLGRAVAALAPGALATASEE